MRLSGVQVQALVWVAFKDVDKPTRRALEQIVDMELAVAPVRGTDPHYRVTDAGMAELRSRQLGRPSRGRKTTCAPRARVTA